MEVIEMQPINSGVQMRGFGASLLGRPLGHQHFGRLCTILAKVSRGSSVSIDFDGVESVNGSWLNAALAPLLPWAARADVDVFPVLCSFPRKDRDELELVSELNKQCFAIAENIETASQTIKVVGPLDHGLTATLRIVVERGEVTGADLGRDSETGPTTWNNRLRDLYERRLLFRRNVGRKQLYSPIAKEITIDG
jgi:hypothetical protein